MYVNMNAPIETVPNPHRRNYVCCQCDECEAIFLLTRDRYTPAFYHCPSCNHDIYVAYHTISPARYKLLRAYYDFKAKLIKLTSRS